MKIIGLCGEKGSGKDTVYEFIKEKYKTKRFAFADPLKESLKKLFLWDDNNFSVDNKEKIDDYWGVSPRQMCQLMGTDVLRISLGKYFNKKLDNKNCLDLSESSDGLHPNDPDYSFHIKRIHKEFIQLDEDFDYIVFTDIRFLDEIKYVKSLGGKIFKIVRPDIIRNEYSKHISEVGVDDEYFNQEVDEEIINDKSLLDLSEKVETLFK